MGNNVAIVVHTDELDKIAKSADFGARLSDAILNGDDTVLGFNTGVLPYDHADLGAPIAFDTVEEANAFVEKGWRVVGWNFEGYGKPYVRRRIETRITNIVEFDI